jgi:hypothetical protein
MGERKNLSKITAVNGKIGYHSILRENDGVCPKPHI